MNSNNRIHIMDETRKRLAEDILAVTDTYQNISVDDLISRAQVFSDVHILDIMYRDSLKEAVKTVINYFAVPMINYDQEFPMHDNFLPVFNFCGHWTACSPFSEKTENNELIYLKNLISVHLTPPFMSKANFEMLDNASYANKQDYLNVLNALMHNWPSDACYMDVIFQILLSILDNPAFDFIDSPIVRVKFAFILKQLTAYWPEVIWNWDDYVIV